MAARVAQLIEICSKEQLLEEGSDTAQLKQLIEELSLFKGRDSPTVRGWQSTLPQMDK